MVTEKAMEKLGYQGHTRSLWRTGKAEGKAMKKETGVSSPVYAFFPTEVEGFDSLAELALDIRWSWNHSADEVWSQLDPVLWELTQNPWVVLQTVSRNENLRELRAAIARADLSGERRG